MRILYSAIDQAVPSSHGGSVHVTAVAEGLAALGHTVRVLISPGGNVPNAARGVTWIALPPPLSNRRLRLFRAPAVIEQARDFKPDVVIERYFNFGGEGILAAKRVEAVAVLEVNAPIADHPGSRKRLVDRALLIEPMRRWRDWQCRNADLIVTPSARIVPQFVPETKILRTEWGADTTQFVPGASGTVPFVRKSGDTIAVFSGAFRVWHGAINLVDAVRELRRRGRNDIKAVLVGDGPEFAAVRQASTGVDGITLTGAVPHDQVPAILAAADVGVAPFDLASHPSLAYEFHWSPLKVFEYMASGLPVVAPRIERLSHLIGDEKEGLLYDAKDPHALAASLERLTDPVLRQTLGRAARERAVREFSWDSHCRQLDEALRRAVRTSHADPDRH